MSGFLSGWGVRLAIVAVIIVGGFVLRDRLSSSAGDLKVGDCFDEPASGGEISDVQHHPCTESHSAEVVFLGEMTGDNSTYPTDDQFDQYAATNCLPAFTAYTGRAVETETELTMSYYVPTKEGWGKGSRQEICYVLRVDNQPLTQSVKAAAQFVKENLSALVPKPPEVTSGEVRVMVRSH